MRAVPPKKFVGISWGCEICWVITEYSMGTQRLKEYESRKGHFKWKVLLKSTNNIYSLRNGWINNAYIAMKWHRRMKLRYYSCNGFLKEYRNMEFYSWFVLKIPTNFHLKGNCLVWCTTIFWFGLQLFIWLPLDEILCNSSWSSHPVGWSTNLSWGIGMVLLGICRLEH